MGVSSSKASLAFQALFVLFLTTWIEAMRCLPEDRGLNISKEDLNYVLEHKESLLRRIRAYQRPRTIW